MLLVTLLPVQGGCSRQMTRGEPVEMLNAVLWMQTSAEYTANARQAYTAARANLELALADPHWTAALEQGGDYSDLPPAVIVDLDQTVLDNTAYNANMLSKGQEHSQKSHLDWCLHASDPAVPGVREFIDYAASRGVVIIYNSARSETMRACTTRNLQALGLPLQDQDALLLADGTPGSAKSRHRGRVCRQYRVLLLIGDDLNDFVDGSRVEPSARRAMASQYAGRWGKEWIILPNTMYGSWETSLYDFDYTLPREERLNLKLQQLVR